MVTRSLDGKKEKGRRGGRDLIGGGSRGVGAFLIGSLLEIGLYSIHLKDNEQTFECANMIDELY